MTCEPTLPETTTPRLVLRRPGPADRDFYIRLHEGDAEGAEAGFAAVLESWRQNAFGTWVAVDRASGRRLGWAGVQPHGARVVRLTQCFASGVDGPGLAREAARAAVATATEWLPGRRIEAVAAASESDAIDSMRAAGLVPVATDPGASLLQAPRLTRVDALDPAAREELLALGMRVNDSGGSVGFLPGAPRERVAAALAEHEAQMVAGLAFAGALRDPDRTLVGWAWWRKAANPLLGHARWLYRLMVDPHRQGRNLGAILMAGLIGLARADGGELLRLDYRSGSGLGDFYARFGFREVGRVGGAIRVAPGDERDDVSMARRTDGAPIRFDGRA